VRIIASGGEGPAPATIESDGLLARKAVGKGVAIFCMLDPAALQADKYTYFRFTRWRMTRALTQILANMGATFKADSAIFNISSAGHETADRWMSLVGPWKVKATRPMPGDKKAEEPGISEEAKAAVAPDFDDAAWPEHPVPSPWEKYGDKWNLNGEVVYRKTLDLPAEWAGKNLELDLGGISDFESTFFNGVPIGASGAKISTWTLPKRYYSIPGHLVKAGRNVLAVRVWNQEWGGGLRGTGAARANPEDMCISVNVFYHSDRRRDYTLGDDPYRYYRW
jgi:hypothetical protein